MGHKVALIPGDGIGPEIAEQAVRILDATGVSLEWETVEAGHGVSMKYGGDPLPESTLSSIRRNGVALKGPLTTQVMVGRPSVNVALRKSLELYAAVRPIKSLPGVASRYSGVDLVVIRENTEDLYCGIEHLVVPGVVETLKLITEKASLRIARYAFEMSRREGRRKVTVIHKANIMKLSDGLFLECCRRVAREYPDILYQELIVDNACMQLVRDPARFAFAHGGKDGHPYPVDRQTYDRSIQTLHTAVERAKLGRREQMDALKRLAVWTEMGESRTGESGIRELGLEASPNS